jgi:hypothetical protein
MDPEETFVPSLPMALANRPASVLVQKFANHRLCNGMKNGGFSGVRSWIS